MKKLLFIFIALIGCFVTLEAQVPYQRATGTQTKNLRQLNREQHFAKSKKSEGAVLTRPGEKQRCG